MNINLVVRVDHELDSGLDLKAVQQPGLRLSASERIIRARVLRAALAPTVFRAGDIDAAKRAGRK